MLEDLEEIVMANENAELSHVDPEGRPRMVNVGEKPLTRRRAVAAGLVTMRPETLKLALGGGGPKGPVIDVARLAGITGAKRTADLVPLCHPLPLDQVDVEIAPAGENALEVRGIAEATWRTGVEMEAFTAVVAAAMTLIDMLKAVDREMTITNVRLLEKSGGRSQDWSRGDS